MPKIKSVKKPLLIYLLLLAFSFSAPAGTERLWNILEGSLDTETFQLHLAKIIVSEQESVEKRKAAVSRLARSLKLGRLPEDVNMALIDVIRLQNTPYKVKIAISLEGGLRPSIRDEANQMEILNYALSEKGQKSISRRRPETGLFIQRVIADFPYPSRQVKRKIIELALHPKTSEDMFKAAVEHIQTKGFYDFENGGEQIFFEDLQFFHTAGKIHQASPAMVRAMKYIDHPSAEVLLNLVKLIVHPNPDFLNFRRPALDILDKHTESLDAEVQKELLAGLTEGSVTEKTADRISLILSQIPQLDPSVKSLVISALSNPDKTKAAKKRNEKILATVRTRAFALFSDFDLSQHEYQEKVIKFIFGVSAAIGFGAGIFSTADRYFVEKGYSLEVASVFGGIDGGMATMGSAASLYLTLLVMDNVKKLIRKNGKCKKAFKDHDPDEGY